MMDGLSITQAPLTPNSLTSLQHVCLQIQHLGRLNRCVLCPFLSLLHLHSE